MEFRLEESSFDSVNSLHSYQRVVILFEFVDSFFFLTYGILKNGYKDEF